MNDFMPKLMKRKIKYLKACGSIMFSGSVFLTFNGFALLADANGSGASGYLIAFIMAFASGAFFYAFWQTAMGAIMGQRSMVKQLLLIALTALGLPFIISISSWSNVTAIAGNSAMDMHQVHTLTLAEGNLTQNYKHSSAIKNLIPDIEGEIAAYRKLATEELLHGKVSKHKGPGAIVDALNNTADRLEKLLEAIQAHIRQTEKKVAQAQKLLGKARKEAAKDKPIAERQNVINAHIDQLNLLFSDIDVTGLAESVRRTLNALPTSSQSLTYLSLSPSVAKRQKQALSAIEKSLDATSQTLSEVASQIAALPDIPAINHKRISPMEAVWIYAGSFIPAWIGGLTLDIGMLWPLLMIMVAISGLSDEEKARLRVEGTSLADAFDAELGKERLRGLRQNGDDVKRDNDAFYGRNDNNNGDRV